MLNKETNDNKKLVIRAIIMVLTIFLSMNVEIEIIRPNLTLKISTKSNPIQQVTKLLEWF